MSTLITLGIGFLLGFTLGHFGGPAIVAWVKSLGTKTPGTPIQPSVKK